MNAKDFETRYVNHVPYPDKQWLDTQRAQRVKAIDDTPLTKAQRSEAFRELYEGMVDLRRKQIDARRDEDARLMALFRADCEEELSLESVPSDHRAKIHELAWQYGHASGYHEVFHHYLDIASVVVAIADECSSRANVAEDRITWLAENDGSFDYNVTDREWRVKYRIMGTPDHRYGPAAPSYDEALTLAIKQRGDKQ